MGALCGLTVVGSFLGNFMDHFLIVTLLVAALNLAIREPPYLTNLLVHSFTCSFNFSYWMGGYLVSRVLKK